MLRDLVTRNRSYRRFDETVKVTRQTLRGLVDLARLGASGQNLQPLRYVLSCEPDRNATIFPLLEWAGYLRDWPGPAPGERPAAYIVMLGDRRLGKSFRYDCGIAAQTILLGAVARGLGGCIIGSVQRERLRSVLSIPDSCEILLVLALGRPAEQVRIEPLPADGDIRYWRDGEGIHHVPKRDLDEIILA